MRTIVLFGLAGLTGLVGTVLPAAAQDMTAEVRTWSGESWRLTQAFLGVHYTIMPPAEGGAPPGGAVSTPAGQETPRLSGSVAGLSSLLAEAPEPAQGHRQREVVTFIREGVETQISLASIRSLQFFRQPVENSPFPPYLAGTHFRYSATAVLVDGSRVEGDYVNWGTTVLRGVTPNGRVDIPWQKIENVHFEPAEAPVTTEEWVTPPLALAEAPAPHPKAPEPVNGEIASLEDVFFDFDSSVLTDDAKGALHGFVMWLKANSDASIVVEGHADERGTNMYNLALGERRANAIRGYLMAIGIAGNRISTLSYGEERPFVAGHDESAWQWNRRAHLVVTR